MRDMAETHPNYPPHAIPAAAPAAPGEDRSLDLAEADPLLPVPNSLAVGRVPRRERLLYALAGLGYPEIESDLRSMARGQHASITTRRRTLPIYLDYLRKIGWDPTEFLPLALEDPACEVREVAIDICRELKDESMITFLAPCLGDRSLPLQAKAMWTIRSMRCQDPGILYNVLDFIDDPCGSVASRILAMQAIGYPHKGNWALERLRNSIRELMSLPVRIWAAETYAYLGDKEEATSDLFTLIGYVHRDDPDYKPQMLSLLWALAKVGGPLAASHLEQYLDSSDHDYVEVAIAGLGNSGDQKYQPILLKLLEEAKT